MIYQFKGIKPVVHESSFVHPQASVIGDVIIGKHVYIGPGVSLRGDFGQIVIEDGCNVQDNCTIHMFPGVQVLLKENAHIGHGAVVHGAQVGKNVMVGMNSVLMDNVVAGDNSIIGAMTFVPTGMIIPERKVVVGNPAKLLKDVTDEMLVWKTEGTRLYQVLASDCLKTMKSCEPLRRVSGSKPAAKKQADQAVAAAQKKSYKIWKETKRT